MGWPEALAKLVAARPSDPLPLDVGTSLSVCLDVCMVCYYYTRRGWVARETCVCVISSLDSAASRAARLKPEQTSFSPLTPTPRH